jgi:hypothetical protein
MITLEETEMAKNDIRFRKGRYYHQLVLEQEQG